MGVSAIILTKNSQDTIVDCLDSVVFCDEIIIIDDNSSDNTLEVVHKLMNSKIKVIKHQLNNDFSSQRNFAITKADKEWILFVDSDEIVSHELGKNIKLVVDSNNNDGILIKRADFLWGKKLLHGETGEIYLLRLARKGRGKWTRKVHEEWKVEGRISKIKGELIHHPHKSIFSFVLKINIYTTIRSLELYRSGNKVSLFGLVSYPAGKFLVNFFLKKGFLDGEAGFVHASLMSFHSFLVRAKLFLLQKGITKAVLSPTVPPGLI